MFSSLVDISSFSIFIPGVISVIRFRQINHIYYPLLYCFWIGCINEVLSLLLLKYFSSTIINNNIYVLIESLLILWFFNNLKIFKSYKYLYFLLNVLFILIWITENTITGKITTHSILFRISYSFIIVLMSINVINNIITRSGDLILRNATFLICTAFIIYYTYKVLIQAFTIYDLNRTSVFLINISIIMLWINLFINLLYSIAVFLMPKRQAYTLSF